MSSNKMEQYLFVYDEKEGTFPERWKVDENDSPSDLSSDSELNGHIKKDDLESIRKFLKKKYNDEKYVVSSAYGNCWSAIENNYRGLFYDHFSHDSPTTEKTDNSDTESQLPFSSKINSATQQGSFFILLLVAYGIYWGWSEYLLIKGINGTVSWLYQLLFYQPYHLLTSVHVPIFVAIGIYYLLHFSLLLIRKVTINKDGLLITPMKKFILWNNIKEVYAFNISDKYDEMSLFGNCLVLMTNDGKRISLSNRFEKLSNMVELINRQIEQPVIDNMLKEIKQNGNFQLSSHLSIGLNGITIYSRYEQFGIDFERILKITVDEGRLKLYNLENKLIYQEEMQSVKNALFVEKLIRKIINLS